MALQLMFSNGVWTSVFSTPKLYGVKLTDMVEAEIPRGKSVRQISVKVWATSLDGLALVGDEGELLLDVDWC